MVNYQNGKIYTIRCRSDENLIYVGSTSQTLSQRMTLHRSCCKRGDGCSLYDYIIDNDWSDFYIELYEKYPCNDKAELCKREGEIIRQIGTINKCIAGRTKKEYYEDNVDKYKKYYEDNAEKIKEYYEENAEKIKEYKKEYYEDNVDKYKKYYEDNAEKIKKYYEDNIDKIKKYHKEYYEDNVDKYKKYSKEWREENAEKLKEYKKEYYKNNADKISEKNKEKVCCDICGVFIRKDGLTGHQKTKKCTDKHLKNEK